MFYGAVEHIFHACPHNGAPGASTTLFYKNFFAHKPYLCKQPPTPSKVLVTPGTQAHTQSCLTPLISALPPPPSPMPFPIITPSIAIPEATPFVASKPTCTPLLCPNCQVILVASCLATPVPSSSNANSLPPMPIAIDNSLPCATFALASDFTHDLSLCGLMDTCGALNTGYLLFHHWVMSECPVLVAKYLAFNTLNPFEPVKLGGTICNPTNFDPTNHGNLTAIICYHTPYFDTTSALITLSFALVSNITVNIIFGLSMMYVMANIIHQPNNQ
jgi:hypothetical protein